MHAYTALYHSPLKVSHSVSYQVYYWRERSLHKHNPHHVEQQVLTFSGNKSHGMLPGLQPYSLYLFNVRVFNSKGEGPASSNQQFETPEGGRRSQHSIRIEGIMSSPIQLGLMGLFSCFYAAYELPFGDNQRAAVDCVPVMLYSPWAAIFPEDHQP